MPGALSVLCSTGLLLLSEVLCQQQVLGTEDLLTVGLEGIGPSHEDLNATASMAFSICQARSLLSQSRQRILFSDFQNEPHGRTKAISTNDVYRAVAYDYTNARAVTLSGVLFDPSTVSVEEANVQPFSNAEELEEASFRAGRKPNESAQEGMPPILTYDLPNGISHRILNIALNSPDSSRQVYVNMNNGTVSEVPPPDTTENLACMSPLPPRPAIGSGSGKGIPGTANLAISLGSRQLWTFQAIRPSASSGTKGSGIELRNVKYLGKTVLFQAHVPILNVEYEKPGTGCGPYYRDWQFDEWPLQCDGSDLAPGFRLCKAPAKTILDPPERDGGDFRGVAVYVEGSEVVLKSQMKAGWYRYVSEWRFHVDGTIRPRFGFGGVYQAPYCVCQIHHHHVYWRLDFDIGTAGNNKVREFNQPPIIGASNYHDKVYEIRRPKDASHNRRWEISNTRTGSSYELIPGKNDGQSDAYGVGDLWVLKYHYNELDDGVTIVGGSAGQTKADIGKFLNGESVKDTDIVIWYGAHFRHDESQPGEVSHIVGPDIKRVKW